MDEITKHLTHIGEYMRARFEGVSVYSADDESGVSWYDEHGRNSVCVFEDSDGFWGIWCLAKDGRSVDSFEWENKSDFLNWKPNELYQRHVARNILVDIREFLNSQWINITHDRFVRTQNPYQVTMSWVANKKVGSVRIDTRNDSTNISIRDTDNQKLYVLTGLSSLKKSYKSILALA